MEPLKFGIVGVGGMGAAHVDMMIEMAETELVAVADVNPETAQKAAEKSGAKAFGDYKELIQNGGIEAVLIATPHYFHPPVAEFAAQHGVHVMSEKPIAVTVSAADKMVETCKKHGVMLGVMFQQRVSAARIKMHEMVANGELGDLHRVTIYSPWYRTQAYYDMGSWRGTWKGEGGGILMNQAPHTMDQFVWIGGMPKSVQAIVTTRHHNIEVENTGVAIFDYGDGKLGWLYASTAEVPGGGERFEVAGDKGMLSHEGDSLRFYELEERLSQHIPTAPNGFGAPAGKWIDVPFDDKKSGNHGDVTKAFVRAVRANDESLMVATGEDGLRALEIANGMLLAGFTHEEVELPVDRARYDDMLKRLCEGASPDSFRKK